MDDACDYAAAEIDILVSIVLFTYHIIQSLQQPLPLLTASSRPPSSTLTLTYLPLLCPSTKHPHHPLPNMRPPIHPVLPHHAHDWNTSIPESIEKNCAVAPLSLCVIRLEVGGYHVFVPPIGLVDDYPNCESMTFKS